MRRDSRASFSCSVKKSGSDGAPIGNTAASLSLASGISRRSMSVTTAAPLSRGDLPAATISNDPGSVAWARDQTSYAHRHRYFSAWDSASSSGQKSAKQGTHNTALAPTKLPVPPTKTSVVNTWPPLLSLVRRRLADESKVAAPRGMAGPAAGANVLPEIAASSTAHNATTAHGATPRGSALSRDVSTSCTGAECSSGASVLAGSRACAIIAACSTAAAQADLFCLIDLRWRPARRCCDTVCACYCDTWDNVVAPCVTSRPWGSCTTGAGCRVLVQAVLCGFTHLSICHPNHWREQGRCSCLPCPPQHLVALSAQRSMQRF